MRYSAPLTRVSVLLTILAGFSLLTSCFGFLTTSSHFTKSVTNHSPFSRHQYEYNIQTSTRLYLQKNITEVKDSADGFLGRIEDSGLLTADLFAIVIASQLIGLLDIVNDPEWIKNGGWFQPISTTPKTLDVLVQRISTLSVTWLLASLVRADSFSYSAIANDEDSIQTALKIVLNFTVLRLIFAFVLAGATNGDLQLAQVLRECYFVALAVPGLRFLYGQYFR